MKKSDPDNWSVDDSSELYGIKYWGADYFSVSDKGLITVTTGNEDNKTPLALLDIVSDIKERGMNMPVLVRFEDLLERQIGYLNNAFANAIKKNGYNNLYRGVFPIKVNQ